jgi:2-polyprenyl-6-methoxyphenol hydroxylase-like FAD-dependent oxidoreductase
MITCHLTKLETALDQIKKSYPKLKPADAALVASALSLTGRHALAVYDEKEYLWPDDFEGLTHAMVGQLEMIQESIESTTVPVKKTAKVTPEEEPVVITLGLKPNMGAGEKLLTDRDDLKALLSDILQEKPEFVYSPTDIGWQWALDRANWATVSKGELSRRIRIKANFVEGASGVETGTTTKKRATKAKPVEPVEAEALEPVEEVA